ncbi:MAG: VCBS repeat-containing protein [Calothrix sp. SM1_7_51]|nr:VCBS repeat-containing protein [Calothrix sp. SM1_7_51]
MPNRPGLTTESTINVNVEALGEKYDFDGDGLADILWRRPNTGENGIWKLNQFTVDGRFLEEIPGSDWKMITGADFNGDRKGDILWRNYKTGEKCYLANGWFSTSQL